MDGFTCKRRDDVDDEPVIAPVTVGAMLPKKLKMEDSADGPLLCEAELTTGLFVRFNPAFTSDDPLVAVKPMAFGSEQSTVLPSMS